MKEIKQVKREKNKRNKRHTAGKIFLSILIIVLLLICFRCGLGKSAKSSEYEKKVNQITEIDYAERQAAINTLVEEGKMNVNYSPKAVFEGKSSLLFNVKNIENNHAAIRFEIFDEANHSIYTSKLIEPGYEMNQIELEKELSKGIHDCTIKVGYAKEGNVSSVFPISIEVR